MTNVSPTRLYGATIAIVSGVYSLAISLAPMLEPADMMGMRPDIGLGGWLMAALGAVVLVHGLLLLTPLAARFGRWSGRLMIVWAGLMLLNQLWLATGMSGSMMAAMTWDPGMVAIAVLMLASGLIMLREPAGMAD